MKPVSFMESIVPPGIPHFYGQLDKPMHYMYVDNPRLCLKMEILHRPLCKTAVIYKRDQCTAGLDVM